MDPFSNSHNELEQYRVLINDLNYEVEKSQPEDILQFCFDFFMKKLFQERSNARSSSSVSMGVSHDVGPHPSDITMQDSFASSLAPMDKDEYEEQEDVVSDDLPKFNAAHLKNRRVSVSAESMQPKSSQGFSAKSAIPKSENEMELIKSSLQSHFLFRNLEEDQKQQVIDCMEERFFKVGDTVIEQGGIGDFFYIVSQGSLDCFVNGNLVTKYEKGGSFGELALMYNAPRAATIKATSDVVLWALDRVSFRSLLMETHAQKRQMHEEFLKEVPLFKSLEIAEIHKIADALEPICFRDGEIVLKQGDVGDNFYLIEKGEALFYQTVYEDAQPQKINEMKKGDYFGELALLTDKPRAATVVAKGDLKCVTLGKAAFTRLLGPVMNILKRNTANYHAVLKEAQT